MKTCTTYVKEKASAMLVAALGDKALRVCSSKIGEPLEMLKMLDNLFASSHTATRISALTTMYTKRFNPKKDNMGKFIDEFETLLAPLDRMGTDTKIPESHKAPLLWASLGKTSQLESTVAALRKKDTDDITWESVTSDLVPEWNHIQSTQFSRETSKFNNRTNDHSTHHRSLNARHSGKGSKIKCDFCGKSGHKAEICFVNPKSKQCKLPEKVKKALLAIPISEQGKNDGGKRLQFGGIIKHKTKKLVHNTGTTILDSGATITMFKEKSETKQGY